MATPHTQQIDTTGPGQEQPLDEAGGSDLDNEGFLRGPFSSNLASRNGEPPEDKASHQPAEAEDDDDEEPDADGDQEMDKSDQDQDDRLSDDDDAEYLLRIDSDICLPRAPVKQLIMEKLPADTRIHSSSKELISQLSMLFLNQLSALANDVCSEQEKKTICPDHVLDAMVKMNLTHYFPQIADPALTGRKLKSFANQDVKKQRAAVLHRLNQIENAGKSRAARGLRDKYDKEEDGLTEEQKNLEQEKLFMQARQQFDDRQKKQQLESGYPDGAASFEQQQAPSDMALGFQPGGASMASNEAQPPPFNPTEYFREAIFAVDFLATDADNDVQMTAAAATGESRQAAGDEFIEGPSGGKPPAPYSADHWLTDMGPMPEDVPFKFDEADVKELKAATSGSSGGAFKLTGANGAAAGTGRGSGCGAAVQRKKEDQKPKEQNDQEMEEAKEPLE